MRHLFLDLEDTVTEPILEGWANARLMNIEKVRAFIERWPPDRVHIFSFAIWDDFQLRGFETFLRARLEKALGIEICNVFTVDGHIIPACCRKLMLHPDRVTHQEMNNFWGKQEAFRMFIRETIGRNSPSNEVMLLDDTVLDETFSWPTLNITGHLINVNSLPSCHNQSSAATSTS